ncbi:MAG: hypothetical protein ACQESC_03880 [Nanobdellota archaeon]
MKSNQNEGYIDLESITNMSLDKKYKAIQLDVNGKQTIIFGDPKLNHSQIVKAYLLDNNISFEKDVYSDPLLEGTEYKIIGAGYATNNGSALEFSGDSIGYKISPDEEQLKTLENEVSLDLIVENKDQNLLDTKLRFLHQCSFPNNFNKADRYFNELLLSIDDDEAKYDLQEKYATLKKTFDETQTISKQYNQELRKIRDYLLD